MRTTADRLERLHHDLDEVVHRRLDLEAFVLQAVERIRHTVPFDGYCVRLCDPETSVPNAAISDIDCETAPISYRHEYGGKDFATLPGMRDSGEQISILSHATGGQPERSGRWRDVLEPMGMPYELTGLARQDERVWGHLMLYRTGRRGDFRDQEAAAVGRALRPIGEGIRRAFMTPGPANPVALDHAPAVVVLDSANRIAESTPLPPAWQQALTVPGRFVSPLALQVLATAARSDRSRSARSRLRCPGGGWLSVHATAMESPDPDRVAIVMQNARAGDMAPLMFASLGLTRAEQAVVERILQGKSTKEMAAELFISPHTVQDRLKSIFTKLAVRSRRELVAMLDQRLA